MKRLFITAFLMMLLFTANAQNISLHQTYMAGTGDAGGKNIRLQNNFAFTAKPEFINRNFFTIRDSKAGFTFRQGIDEKADLLFMPSSYQPGEMMSIAGVYSTIGKVKFYCNYYFDAEGQLVDGDITVSKVK